MHLAPEDLSLMEFLSDYGLRNVCNIIIWRWIKLIGDGYNVRRKGYYSDRHEHEEYVPWICKRKQKNREYHIDTHPKFENLDPKILIKFPPNTKPLILIGQDESCFKQSCYSKKCWTCPSGEMKLLPKSDGYTWMISAFISRDFVVGLVVNDEELKLLNQRRQIGARSHFASKKEAVEVYGTSKKKPLKEKHTLIQYFILASTWRAIGTITT